MTARGVAYLRQSVGRHQDSRDGGSLSVAYQLDAVKRWCASHDTELIAWHSDVDESGASRTRKGLDAFVADCKNLQPAYALFWDLSRLSRNLRIFLEVFDALEQIGTQLVSVTEGTRHPAFIWKMLALVAEEQRDRIAQNITHGKREATKRGRHLGNPPLGYRKDDEGQLIIDEETAFIPRWMFARALEGQTPTAICRLANAEGIPTSGAVRAQKGAEACPPPLGVENGHVHPARPDASVPRWSRRTVEALLRRPTYAGLVQSGSGSRARYGKALGVVVAEGAHEPIIDRQSWEAVQARLDGLSRGSARLNSWHWLAGRVTCASCGARLYYVDAARSDHKYRDKYWRCRNSYARTFGRDNEACPAAAARISDAKLRRMVDVKLRTAFRKAATRLDPEAVARKLERERGKASADERQATERRLVDLRAQRVRIADAIQMGVGELAELAKRDRALLEAIERADADLARLPAPVPLPVIEGAIDISRRLRETWDSCDDACRGRTATELGLSVVVDLDAKSVRLGFAEPFSAIYG